MNKSIAVALSCLLAIAAARADDMGKKEPMPMEPKMAPKVQQKHAMKVGGRILATIFPNGTTRNGSGTPCFSAKTSAWITSPYV